MGFIIILLYTLSDILNFNHSKSIIFLEMLSLVVVLVFYSTNHFIK